MKWFKHVTYLQTYSYLPSVDVCMCEENKKLNKSSTNKFYSTSGDEEIFSAIFSNFNMTSLVHMQAYENLLHRKKKFIYMKNESKKSLEQGKKILMDLD